MTKEEYLFLPLGEEQIDMVTALQEEAFRLIGNPSMLRRNSRETLLECLKGPHCAVGAFCGEELAAFGILYLGGTSEENLSLLMADAPDPEKCANIKLIIVAGKHRGRGLQRRLIQLLEERARALGCVLLCATVSPDNAPSLDNFRRTGYNIYGEFSKYGGLSRLLLYKYIDKQI